jgi:hypothetical protein
MINFTNTQLEAVTNYVTDLSPKEEQGFRRTLEEMKMLYNPEMENCIIVKSRVFEIDNGEQYDRLRYVCFKPDGSMEDIRKLFPDNNARYSFYHDCREIFVSGGKVNLR